MIRNYITIAFRNLLKNRLFTFINIFGLALSMYVCMMVIVDIIDNFGYDTFHPNGEKSYRVISEITNGSGSHWRFASTPLPLREALLSDTAILENVIHIYPALRGEAMDSIKEVSINGAFTQQEFFEVFGFELSHGDKATALSKPFNIVLSKGTSKKMFGNRNAVGKNITFKDLGTFEITGIMEDPPKTHLGFEAYASASTIIALESTNKLPKKLNNWDTFENAYTYVSLKNETDDGIISHRLDIISNELNKNSTSGNFHLALQPLGSITPSPSDMFHEISRGGTWGGIFAGAGIGFIILIAACFNYTNLSIARALTRGKEVGIRKLSGAVRSQIFIQYITESVIVALFALLISGAIFNVILEYQPFNDGYEMVPSIEIGAKVILGFIVFAVVSGIIAGAMPAWILSSFKPARVLRNIGSEKLFGSLTLRKSLMVFQFSLSLVVIIFLSVFYKQFDFMKLADPGFARERIIAIPFNGDEQRVLNAFSQVGGVQSLGAVSSLLGKRSEGVISLSTLRSDERPVVSHLYSCDAGAIDVMELKLVAGRNFNLVTENSESMIINEKAAEELGFKTPSQAVGSEVFSADSATYNIVGVVRNFYDEGVGNAIRPLSIQQKPGGYSHIIIKADNKNNQLPQLLTLAWKKIFQDEPFTYIWLDDDLRAHNDQRAEISLLGFLAFITITIASLGLLGLVVYTVETRRKEISIRKIVGATARQVTLLLSRGFLSLLGIAGIIALPIGYALSEFFLYNFTNRISIGAETLVFCFALLLTIGLVTILSQTYSAAQENPARNLRSE